MQIRLAFEAIGQLQKAINLGKPIPVAATSPVHGGAELDDPGVALPGLLFAAGLYAGQIGTLAQQVANDGRNRDWHAALLLRSLYEYVVTFCWLAADSAGARAERWANEDKRLRIATAKELQRISGKNPLPSKVEAKFSAATQNHKKPPTVEQQAREADAHWCVQCAEFGALKHPTSKNPGPLTDAYPLIYRNCSSVGHPTPQALQKFFVQSGTGSGQFLIGTRADSSSRFFYTQAPMIFALAIYVGSSLFKWVDASHVEPAFANWQARLKKDESLPSDGSDS